MIIGVLNSSFNGYTHGFRFHRTGTLKAQADQDSGVTVQLVLVIQQLTAGQLA